MPIFGPNETANRNWLSTNNDVFRSFLNSPLQDPLTQPVFSKSWAVTRPYTVEFNSIFNSYHLGNIFHPTAFPNGVVGQALMPGKSTFLGGAGVAITAKSQKKELGWKYLQILASPNFQRLMNRGLETPYVEVLETSREWNLPESDAVRLQFRRAVPPQYPQNAFVQGSELESRAPWRAYLAEMMYKNATYPVLIDRLCKVVDYVMLPTCSADQMTIVR
jgi:ABC-type glycerol-3-phosphate transport system substrate-binding protein